MRINRNIVECKDLDTGRDRQESGVLIETLWNVKTAFDGFIMFDRDVLIETLWNVKKLYKEGCRAATSLY